MEFKKRFERKTVTGIDELVRTIEVRNCTAVAEPSFEFPDPPTNKRVLHTTHKFMTFHFARLVCGKFRVLAKFGSHASMACKFQMSQCEPAALHPSPEPTSVLSFDWLTNRRRKGIFGASKVGAITKIEQYNPQRQPWDPPIRVHSFRSSGRNNSDRFGTQVIRSK